MTVSIRRLSPVAHLPLVLGVLRKLEVAQLIDTITLQRHLSALTKFAHVESRVCGRKQQGKAVLYPSENPCVKKPVPISVAVGIFGVSSPNS